MRKGTPSDAAGRRPSPGKAAPLTRRKKLFFVFLLAFVFPLLSLALLEAGLRIAGYGFSAGFFLPLQDGAYIVNQKFGWRFFHPAIARTPVPYRLTHPKPAGTYRVFVLGESAAMGFPDPAFSFGRMLEAMLRSQYPGVRFEVVNAAMTAINSHVILPIAHDCARREPDLFVIYMGNNEVVGPFGAGTVFGRQSPPLPLIRLSIAANAARTGQLLGRAVWSRSGRQPRDWGGMEMFSENLVPVTDPRMEKIYGDFRRNLHDILTAARRSGAPAVLCTVPVNLRDSAPFASVHPSGFTGADRAQWERYYLQAAALVRAAKPTEAAAKFRDAAALDAGFAELHFRLAECLTALGEAGQARAHYLLARDLDALRFRADTRLNDIIREAAGSVAGVHLVDAERAFEADDPIPGEGLFYEHVHLTLHGNYLLARTVFERVAALLPEWIATRNTIPVAPSESDVAARLGLTARDRHRAAAEVFDLMSRPPFTNQFDHARRIAVRERRLAELLKESQAALDSDRRTYAANVDRYPDDLHLRANFAELLWESEDCAGAAAHWRTLIQRVPGVTLWHTRLGDALRDQERLDEAEAQYQAALDIDPWLATVHFGLGAVLERRNRREEAVERYRRALELKPAFPEAHNNFGVVLAAQANYREAIGHYLQALRFKPAYAEAHHNLGQAYAAAGEAAKAIGHYHEAVRINPHLSGSRLALAGALAALGRASEAMVHYREALSHAAVPADAHYNYGLLLARAGRTREAIEQYQAALRIRPEYPEAENNLGNALARAGDIGLATRHFRRALKINPTYAEAHYNLGVALSSLGRNDDAIAHLQEALRLRPDFAQARHQLDLTLASKTARDRSR